MDTGCILRGCSSLFPAAHVPGGKGVFYMARLPLPELPSVFFFTTVWRPSILPSIFLMEETGNYTSSCPREVSVPSTWYAIRTFNCQELRLGEFLTENGKEYFIPMTYAEKRNREGRVRRVLVPVVHNLLFVRKDVPQRQMLRLLSECNLPLNIFRREGTTECYEIPDSQMLEFRSLCDPNFRDTLFMTSEEADAKPGKLVEVIHGPFAGMTGKLHRVRNDFYFIKTLVGIGVMLRISRWYCRVLDKGEGRRDV